MTRRNKRIKQKAAKTSGGGNTARRRRFPPETAEQYFALSKSAQGRWNGITHVVSKLRVGDAALWEISPEFDVDPRTVVRHAKTALRKLPNGRYAANPTDNLLRILVLPTNDGLREVAIHDSREASVLSNYWAAVEKYLQTGDASALRKIRRKTIVDSNGKRVWLIKDLAELDRLGSAGVLSFESIYAKVA